MQDNSVHPQNTFLAEDAAEACSPMRKRGVNAIRDLAVKTATAVLHDAAFPVFLALPCYLFYLPLRRRVTAPLRWNVPLIDPNAHESLSRVVLHLSHSSKYNTGFRYWFYLLRCVHE
jgi:hypothetical protein